MRRNKSQIGFPEPGTKNKLFLLLLCFVSLQPAFAQPGEIVFNRLTKENGLSATLIHSIIKDRQGYYWLSSVNGLQRFDGNRMLSFHNNVNDSTSLPSNNVGCLMEDNRQRLWMNAGGYPCVYNSVHRNFKKIPVEYPTKKTLSIKSFFQDSKGLIWMVAEKDGLFVLDTIKNIFTPYTSIWPKFFSEAYSMVEDEGRFWLATDKGCVVYDSKNKIYLHRKNNPELLKCFEDKDFADYCNRIYLDRNRILWTSQWVPGNSAAISYRYDLRKNELAPVKFFTNIDLAKFVTDQLGTTWAYYGTILGRFDTVLNGVIEVPTKRKSLYGIDFNEIGNMYEDADGTIWIMSDLGLYSFNPRRQYFTTLNGVWSYWGKKTTDANITGLLQNADGHILSTCWGDDGITFYDSSFNQLKPLYGYNPSDKKMNWNQRHSWTGMQDSRGIIWIGCQYGNIIRLDPISRKVIRMSPPEFEAHTIRSIMEDKDGNIWFGTQRTTLVKWERKTNKFRTIIFRSDIKQQYDWILAILQGTNGDLWMTTGSGGLLHLDIVTEKIIEQFKHDDNNPQSIGSNLLTAIVPISKDTLAISTDKGIDLFSVSKKTFSHITEADGLPGGFVWSMLADDKSNLWFTTSEGISKIHLPDKRIHNYKSVDGITERGFQFQAALKLKDGRMVFGNTRGLVYFNPERVDETATPSDVTISGFRIFDKTFSVDSLLKKDNKISLKHSQNYISIQFASLGNIMYNQPVYYYKLEGIDKNWIRAENNQEAIYTYLPGGYYTFNVKCVSQDGIECKNITSFRIFIQPPLYLRWWFIVLSLSIIGGVLYYIYLLRLRRRKERELIRNRIARDLHDDMGSVLSTINILSTMTKTKIADDPVKASEYIGKISDNSQRMMEAMDDIVWSIKPANDSMQKITARMREFATSILEAKDIELDFKVDEKVNDIKLNMEARRDFFLIFKEAVNNVAKYSRCSKCSIHISLHQHRLLLNVQDNGIGFDVNKADSGNGLSNMQKRAEAMKGRISIQSKPGEGTQVTLNMPVQ